MEHRGSIVLVLSALFVAVHSQTATTAVTTSKGPVTGLKFTSVTPTGASFDSYRGIPYGDQPTRFKVAAARTAWTTTLAANTDAAPCPQPGITTYSEDCLYLNVYTPTDAATNKATKTYPVMVFIHGAAFTAGSSSSAVYGPDFLVPQGVILVTMNYRLGALGFLTLGSKEAPGNLGLTDTLLALNWVKTEIANFGGDPKKVTLFGQSSGSIMTQFHYLSGQSAGLFARAIAQSGSALAPWGLVSLEEGVRRAKLLASSLGCDTSKDNATIVTCLQGKPIADILKNQSLALSLETMVSGNGLPFVPVFDNSPSIDAPFFNDTIANMMTQALNRNMPLLTGFTTDEGILRFTDNTWMQAENNLAAFVPQSATGDRRNSLSTDVKTKYFNVTVTENKIEDLVSLFTDYMFAHPSLQVSRFFAQYAYGYVFAYDGSWAPSRPYFNQFRLKGVNHGDDLSYLFYSSIRTDQVQDTCSLNTANIAMKTKMVSWWTTFATTGAPDTTSTWKTIGADGYIVIDSTTGKMNVSSFEDRYFTFWNDLETSSKSSATSLFSLSFLFISLYTLVIVHL